MPPFVLSKTGTEVASTCKQVDPYLKQVILLLEKHLDTVYEIINQKLLVQQTYCQISFKIPTSLVESGGQQKSINTLEDSLNLVVLVSAFGHKLKNVVLQELQAIKILQDIESKTPRKISKLIQLKAGLENFTTVVDKIMCIYSAKSMGFETVALPSIDELKNAKDKVNQLKKQLKMRELHKLFASHSKDFLITEENIMCNFLGLIDDFGNDLHALNLESRTHQTNHYFLERFIENKENELIEGGFKEESSGKKGLIASLERLGFTNEAAVFISQSIPDEYIDLQQPIYWAKRYLDYAFSYHPLFSHCPRYPFPDKKQNSFFTENILLSNRCEPDGSQASKAKKWPIKMINVTKEGYALVDKLLEEENKEDFQLLFHGTSHKSALSILKSGIDITKGRNNQDFSSGDGFYVRDNFEKAKTWIRAGQGQHQAVIVFKVKKSLLDPVREGGLDVTNNEQRWKEIVHLCRLGYEDMNLKKRLLKGIKFIVGSICHNPIPFVNGLQPASGFNKNLNTQWCIRDEEYAEKFGSIENICCVIFQ